MFATLMYHIVDRRIRVPIAVSEEAFEAQLAHLRREGYTILTLEDVRAIVAGARRPPRDGVYVTFDDAYSDNLTTALPRLREQGIEATMFVPTAHVGQSNEWNKDARYRVRHLDWQELGLWLEGGGRIGGHMHEHRSVETLDRAELRAALALNKRLLEERLGEDVRVFAYPYGDVNDDALAETAALYDVAFSVYQGGWDFGRDRFALNRLAVDHHYTVRDFGDAIERLFASFDAHARTGGAHVFEQFPSEPGPPVRRLAARFPRPRRRRRPLRLVELGVSWPPETFLRRKFERLSAAGLDIQAVAYPSAYKGAVRGCRLVRLPRWDGSRIRAGLSLIPQLALLLVSRPRGLRAVLATRRTWGQGVWPGVRQWSVVLRMARIRGDVIQFEWLAIALRWAHLFEVLGDRVVVTCHGAEVTAYPHMPRWARPAAGLPDLFRRAVAVHCVSFDVAAEGARYGLDADRSVVIHPAVDTDFFRPRPPSAASGPGLALVSVGQLRWLKGYEYVLLAVAELARADVPVVLDLVGGDLPPDSVREHERERILTTITDLGLEEKVRLHGEIGPAAVRDRMQAADVFLHLSLTEGLPNVILEAMACGLPVVATDVGGTREAVRDGTEGILLPPRDPIAAAAALDRLWRNAGLRARMGAAGRARVEADFSLESETTGFLDLYEDIVSGRRPAVVPSVVRPSER
jgi:glycosyltransferase involved in cell wall biosynthesis